MKKITTQFTAILLGALLVTQSIVPVWANTELPPPDTEESSTDNTVTDNTFVEPISEISEQMVLYLMETFYTATVILRA